MGGYPPDGELRLWTETGPAEIRRVRLERLSLPLLRILEAADTKLRGRITAALRSCRDTVLECLLPMLRHAAREQTEGDPGGGARSGGTGVRGQARHARATGAARPG
ncbi:hypothetical protein [Streptomyces sp. NPDC012510]|uniref:hypothetical protein n=1 Tax=Streptomyces sp. NPDC012510 TaxID=3364838 RepID=UPI0036E36151